MLARTTREDHRESASTLFPFHCHGGCDRSNGECQAGQQRQPDSTSGEEAVEDELAQPLLVDPLSPVRPRSQGVVVREAVRNEPTAEQSEPAVLPELIRRFDDEADSRGRDEDDGERFSPEKRNGRSADAPGESAGSQTRRSGLSHLLEV